MLSQMGTYMQIVAEGWLIYRLTDSAFTLGLVGFVAMIPLIPWTLVSGSLADRFPRRKLLFITQLALIFPPLLLAFLTWQETVQVWHIVIISFIMGALSALDQPSRQALVVDTVNKEDMDQAVALSATGYNLARVIGPVLAGWLIASFGEAIPFLINGVSFLAVAGVLALMILPENSKEPEEEGKTVVGSLLDGLQYAIQKRIILGFMAMIIIVNLFIVPYQTLLPVFSRDIYQAGAMGLGLLTTAAGIGAIIGSILVANIKSGHRGRMIIILGSVMITTAVGFALSPNFAIACIALLFASGTLVAIKVFALMFVQQEVDNKIRGRIMSIVVLFDAGVPRLGGLLAGALVVYIGAPITIVVGALGCTIFGILLYTFVPSLRRIV